MFGSFAFKNSYFIFLMALCFALHVFSAPAFKGKIISESAIIYQDPDFDSKVLGQVSGGKVFEISKKSFILFT